MAKKFFGAPQAGNATSVPITFTAGGNIRNRVLKHNNGDFDGATANFYIREARGNFGDSDLFLIHTMSTPADQPKIVALDSDYQIHVEIVNSGGGGTIDFSLSGAD